MKHYLNFAVLMGLLVPAAMLVAQTPARMALPTGGLNPPAMSGPQPAKNPAPIAPAKATTPAVAAPATTAPAQPVLVAAQPAVSGTPAEKPAALVLPTTGPAKPVVPAVAPAVAASANPFDAAPATPATPVFANPEFKFVVQKPILPAATTPPASPYDRTALQQPEPADGPKRIRDCLLKAIDEVQLPAQEAGVLIALSAIEGQEVSKDQPLGRIDDAQPRLQKKAAEAERNVSIEKGKSTINEQYALKASDVARKEFEKAEESNRIALNSVSQVEVMRLKLTWEKGLLERERAVEERKVENLTVMAKDVDVEAADDAIRRRQLVSPINGTIVEITPHVGEWLKPGDPVLKIVNLEYLKIEGFVNIQHISPDQLRKRTVDVFIDVGEKMPLQAKATMVFVSPIVDPAGDYRITAKIKNEKNPKTGDWYLTPGFNVEIVLNEEAAKK